MARRKKSNPAEALFDSVSLLPWWAGVGLALLFYALLHSLAVGDPMPGAGPAQNRTGAAAVSLEALATVGQYLLPLMCIAAAAASAWRRHRHGRRLAGVSVGDPTESGDAMRRGDFERAVGEAFRRQGYQVVQSDGGIDLTLRKDRESFLVHCNHWKTSRVGVEAVQALYGVMKARGATGGFILTSGRFSREAHAFASGCNVRLIDGAILNGMIGRAVAQK